MAEAADDRQLLVLGMHRSGTSCLAGMLEAAGCDSGATSDYNAHNRHGNREDPAVVAFNDRVLALWGGAWDRPPELPSSGPDPRLTDALRRLMLAPASPRRPRVVKDPRVLLTLPLWRAALPRARRIGIFRHPLRTAQSLYFRAHGRQDLAHGLGLWAAYNQRLLAEHERDPFPLLCFDLPAPVFEASVARALVAECADLVSAGLLQPERAGAFHDPDERHQRSVLGPDGLRDDARAQAALAPALALYDRLCRRAGHPVPADPPAAPALEAEVRRLREADAAREVGDLDRAEVLYRALAPEAAQPSAVWWRIVGLARERRDPGARVRACLEALQALPDDPGLGLELASAWRAQGRPEEALAAIDDVLARRRRWREALLARGAVLQALGRADDAVRAFEEADVVCAGSPWSLVPYAVALRAVGRVEAAEQAFQAALERNPAAVHPLVRQQWAQALAAAGDLAAARREFDLALAAGGEHAPAVRTAYVRLLRRHRLAVEADRIETAG